MYNISGDKMYCLKNLNRIMLNKEVITLMIKAYEFKGKNFYYHEKFNKTRDLIKKEVLEKDSYFWALIFKFNINNTRLKAITKGKTPYTKDEIQVRNFKYVINLIQDRYDKFDFNPNDLIDIIKRIYHFDIDKKNVGFKIDKIKDRNSIFNNESSKSRRVHLENLITDLKNVEKNKEELITIIANFYVDFKNLDLLEERNDELGYIILYIMLLYYGFESFNYISFFEIFYNRLEEFEKVEMQAALGWEDGYSQTIPMQKLLLEIILESYDKLEYKLRDYLYDEGLNKGYNIENTILKLNNIFTREEIKKRHPHISQSTINRTLIRMKKENKIKPLGTGRSAKWLKIIEVEKKFSVPKQLGLFEDEEIFEE